MGTFGARLCSQGEGRFAGAEQSLCCSWVWAGNAVGSTEHFSAPAQLLGVSQAPETKAVLAFLKK